MLLFCALTLLAGVLLFREGLEGAAFFVLTYLLAGTMLCLAAIEIQSSGIASLKSDENHFIDVAKESSLLEIATADRALWYMVNYWVLEHDIAFGGLALKCVNIPLFALFTLALYRLFRRARFVWLLPLALPYALWTATFNFRDIPIFLATAMVPVILYETRPRSAWLAIIPLVLLFLLRPFASVMLLGAVAVVELLELLGRSWKGVLTNRKLAGLTLGVAMIAVPCTVTWESLGPVVERHVAWFVHTTGEGRDEHLARFDERYTSSSRLRDLPLSMVRYAVTPLPTSVAQRFLEGGSELWGAIDDLVRLIHQTAYYLMSLYLVVNWRTALRQLRKLTRGQHVLILAFLTYWPIYSFHSYGVTHQRVKLPLQFVVFLLCFLVKHSKSARGNPPGPQALRGHGPVVAPARRACMFASPSALRARPTVE